MTTNQGPCRLKLTGRACWPPVASLRTITMLKTLIIAIVLLPMLAIAQQSEQRPQPRRPGQWCPVGWLASGSYCVPGSDKAPAAIPKNGWCPAGWRESGSYCIR
jgi:hypothetical protein